VRAEFDVGIGQLSNSELLKKYVLVLKMGNANPLTDLVLSQEDS